MTNQEINKAIAEHLGWKELSFVFDGKHIIGDRPSFNNGEIASYTVDDVPDYCNDLNEMHELENTLYKGFIDKDYWRKGYGRFQNLLGELSTNPYSANARQRAEAFLRTIGKWKD
jgi:hypothetical protein